MPALGDIAREELQLAAQTSLDRHLVAHRRSPGNHVLRAGRELVSFSCNDYLGLSQDPRVIAAARSALENFGTGAGASRLVTGSHPLYTELEDLLADLEHTDRALVFGSGYLANLGVIPALVGADDLIIADRLVHACMLDGARLSRAAVHRFSHNSLEHCRQLLIKHRARAGRCLILTETVFSMDGDRAPVPELLALAHDHDAWLLTDDAHGLGMLEPQQADLQMGTLSKAVGSYGGYVCASADVIAFLVNRARTLLYSTGLPPATVSAAAEALRIIRDDPALRARPLRNARVFTAALGRDPAQSPIVPVIVGDAPRALAASAMLESHGYLTVAIRPPTVPTDTARLRFAFTATHQESDILRVAALLIEHGYA
jgi:8-amino-7-oxononanoate synthase